MRLRSPQDLGGGGQNSVSARERNPLAHLCVILKVVPFFLMPLKRVVTPPFRYALYTGSHPDHLLCDDPHLILFVAPLLASLVSYFLT
jgi:hypothetical protein